MGPALSLCCGCRLGEASASVRCGGLSVSTRLPGSSRHGLHRVPQTSLCEVMFAPLDEFVSFDNDRGKAGQAGHLLALEAEGLEHPCEALEFLPSCK